MAGERTFMDQALNVINSTPNHPLAGLVNPETGNWWGRTPWSEAAEDHPTVQAGHRLSKSAGGDRLALQDSESNQMEGRFVEGQWRKGVHVERDAIEIGGVPVDLEAAKAWEREGIVPPGTVANAPVVPGWQPGDTLVAPPPDTFTTHEESLPGGAGTTIITGDGASAALIAGMSDLAYLLGGGVSITGTLALMAALSDLAEGADDESEDEPDDDVPSTPPVNAPPPKDPPVKEPPPLKDPPAPKDPPAKEPPKDPPPKDPPPAAPPPPEPPAAPPPPTGASGDSSGGIPGASGGGSAAPEESSPVPSGATSSLSTGNSPLLAFSYSVSDGSSTADAPSGDRFDSPGIVEGFGVSQPGDAVDLPGPDAGFDVPGTDDGFYLPGPESGFDVPGIDDGFSVSASESGFDLPGPEYGSDAPGPSESTDFENDFAFPPSFDGGLR